MDTTTTLTATEVIDRVQTARIKEHEGAVEQLHLAVHWALLHPCRDAYPAGWEDDHGLFTAGAPLAGPGAPLVDEFAPASLAAALGISLEAGQAAARRRPRAHLPTPPPLDLVERGAVPVWRARAISRETHDLSVEAVAFADRLICATPSKIGLVDAARLVQEARLYFDPDRAIADEEHELTRRGVWLRHRGNPATTDVVMTLDTPDALLFDQTVTRIAGELGHLGDTDPLDVRRARAVGILADPQYALDLMSGRDAAPTAGCCRGEPLRPPRPRPVRAVSIEKLGAATTDLLERLAHPLRRSGRQGHRPTRPRPVRRRPRSTSTTHPRRCASSACCATPTASSPAAAETPEPATSTTSPPTSPCPRADRPVRRAHSNLAPLCRTHHRIKTFTAWDYKRLDDGTYVWTSPTGHQYEVHPVSRRPPRRT